MKPLGNKRSVQVMTMTADDRDGPQALDFRFCGLLGAWVSLDRLQVPMGVRPYQGGLLA